MQVNLQIYVTEITEELEISKSTVHGILKGEKLHQYKISLVRGTC